MPATIKDLARETKLGVATISRYLNGKSVKKVNRIKIEEAIEKYDYTINEYARGLRTNWSKSIGLIFTGVDDRFSSVLVANTQKALTAHGYSTILANNNSNPVDEERAVDFLIGRNVDGVITIPIYPSGGAYDKLKKRGIPVVFFDSDLPEYDLDSVIVDNESIGRMAAEYLLKKGHRRVAVLLGPEGSFTADRRWKGFEESFAEAGVALRPECVLRGQTDEQAGADGMRALLALDPRPTAVFCSNYDLTVGAIMALNETRLALGKDLSLIGVDNLSLAKVIRPRLTLISQPYEEITSRGVSMLLDRIEKGFEGGGREVMLAAEFLEGESVADLI